VSRCRLGLYEQAGLRKHIDWALGAIVSAQILVVHCLAIPSPELCAVDRREFCHRAALALYDTVSGMA
jgi:hypothetical protein